MSYVCVTGAGWRNSRIGTVTSIGNQHKRPVIYAYQSTNQQLRLVFAYFVCFRCAGWNDGSYSVTDTG